MSEAAHPAGEMPRFGREFFSSRQTFSRIGDGALGGKARGLVEADRALAGADLPSRFPGFDVGIPRMVVVTTELFDLFMERNRLEETAFSDLPDERLAHAFQRAELPTELAGDLRALTGEVRTPLAVRSSSLLEDALGRPFAGVYGTKMIPNNQADASTRFRRLVEAIKLVWASTYFQAARSYIRGTDRDARDEKMAVIIQEVVGERHGDRFYPHLSGVARSFNFYPVGSARPEDGVVNLALGLGKTIVDGGISWSYSPARPKAPPPYGSVGDLLKNSQVEFWAVNMGRPPAHDPIRETEYMVRAGLEEADYDGTLRFAASTYDAASDRLVPGTGKQGARVLNFAPLLVLSELPLNPMIKALLGACEVALQGPVEIEFAATLSRDGESVRIGFLQVRPMVVSHERVDLGDEELTAPGTLVSSERVLGNGTNEAIADVVYVRPEVFETRQTVRIAAEIESMNRPLQEEGRPYLLIGFGRWGSSDPALGIPVDWGQINGARAIVESTLPGMVVEPSQGSHFFHNMCSFQVSYFWVSHESRPGVDWDWLASLPAERETGFVRHLRLERPLLVKVDGRSGRGGIWRDAGAEAPAP